ADPVPEAPPPHAPTPATIANKAKLWQFRERPPAFRTAGDRLGKAEFSQRSVHECVMAPVEGARLCWGTPASRKQLSDARSVLFDRAVDRPAARGRWSRPAGDRARSEARAGRTRDAMRKSRRLRDRKEMRREPRARRDCEVTRARALRSA